MEGKSWRQGNAYTTFTVAHFVKWDCPPQQQGKGYSQFLAYNALANNIACIIQPKSPCLCIRVIALKIPQIIYLPWRISGDIM